MWVHKPDLVLSSDLGVKPFTTSALVAKVIQFITFIIGFPMALHGAYEKHIPARRVLEIYFLYFSSKTYVVGTITFTSSSASVAISSILASLTHAYEPVHEISNNVVCATSKASDQPAHTRSLVRAFAGRLSIL